MEAEDFLWIAPVIATLLGVLGALGFSLTPLRAWTLIVRRRIWEPVRARPIDIALAVIAFSGLTLVALAAIETLPRLYQCLMTSRCGGNMSGGMINLAMLGFAVAVQELAWLVAGCGQRLLLKRHAI